MLAAFFALFVAFLYGPMSAIYILSFQGPTGGLTFPMNGVSLHWFAALFNQQRTGRFCRRFHPLDSARADRAAADGGDFGAGGARVPPAFLRFHVRVLSCGGEPHHAGIAGGPGCGSHLSDARLQTKWYTSALGAQLTWTLPFGLLIMFAVFSRFNRAYEEAGRDLGASQLADLSDGGAADPVSRA